MRIAKYSLELDDYEQGVIINALNDMRTRLIQENQTTDIVDDVLLKTLRAPKKRFWPWRRTSYESAVR